jgi:hypothetical protein
LKKLEIKNTNAQNHTSANHGNQRSNASVDTTSVENERETTKTQISNDPFSLEVPKASPEVSDIGDVVSLLTNSSRKNSTTVKNVSKISPNTSIR